MAYKGIQELFDEAAERFPQNLAVVRGEERLTYAELRRRTDSLAHSLRAAGSEKGAVVAILLENPVAAITVIIATLKAGAAFVPLDAQIPAPRLETMLADVSPDWLITEW
jgi:non-ribosomal peptide synthetase component F